MIIIIIIIISSSSSSCSSSYILSSYSTINEYYHKSPIMKTMQNYYSMIYIYIFNLKFLSVCASIFQGKKRKLKPKILSNQFIYQIGLLIP